MIEDGGPAFPATWTNDGEFNATAPNGLAVHPGGMVSMQGMSLRDYFAKGAMEALIGQIRPTDKETNINRIPMISYQIADAMLKARKA